MGEFQLTGPPPEREYRLVFTGIAQWPVPSKGDRIEFGGTLYNVLDVTKDSPDEGNVTLDLEVV